MNHDGLEWPLDSRGHPVSVQIDPLTGKKMCYDCWHHVHKKTSCKSQQCECGCYDGRNKGLLAPRYPAKDLRPNLPFTGAIEVK